jgi:hypothetical protein
LTYTLTIGVVVLVRCIGIVVLFAFLVGALLLLWVDDEGE